jgi:hypothetical protein
MGAPRPDPRVRNGRSARPVAAARILRVLSIMHTPRAHQRQRPVRVRVETVRVWRHAKLFRESRPARELCTARLSNACDLSLKSLSEPDHLGAHGLRDFGRKAVELRRVGTRPDDPIAPASAAKKHDWSHRDPAMVRSDDVRQHQQDHHHERNAKQPKNDRHNYPPTFRIRTASPCRITRPW